MCQMWIKESGVVLPRVFWDAINSYNQEGIGIYNIDKKEIIKSEDYEVGWDYINEHKKDKMIVHHRLATSGAKTCDQLHGWDLQNGYVFFHNGMLKTYHGDKHKSDTQKLVEEWTGAPAMALVRYLEATERSSRFILVHKDTGEIIKPKCATWNPVNIKELGNITVDFSNDYAFSYSKLPPMYSRWGGYDEDYNTSSYVKSGRTYKTRSGSSTKKRAMSVLDKKYVTEYVEGAAKDWVHNPKRSTFVNEQLGLEAFAQPEYSHVAKALVMPDVVRSVNTDDYYILGGLDSKDAVKNMHFTNDYAEQITMNLLLECGSGEVVNALVRMARTASINRPLNVWRNVDLLPFIRSYELRIGVREKLSFTLYEFLNVVMTFPHATYPKVTGMTMAEKFSEAFAEELTDDFTYFTSFKKRVHAHVAKTIEKEQEYDRKKQAKKSHLSMTSTDYWDLNKNLF